VPFREWHRGFIQDLGNRDNTKLMDETLDPRLTTLSVELLGQCQSVGNRIAFSNRCAKDAQHKSISFRVLLVPIAGSKWRLKC
jgi:hypothetical protein